MATNLVFDPNKELNLAGADALKSITPQTVMPASAAVKDMTATTRTVDPATGTVSGQLDAILRKGSPLLDRAKAGATQTANSRGLINSTMAAQAGEAAMIDAAMPIAQSDAGFYNQVAGQNQQFQNAASSQNAQLGTQVNLDNAKAAQLASMTNAENMLKAQGAEAENYTKAVLKQLDVNSARNLANIEANYKTLMQADQSVAEIYKQSQDSISAILRDTNLDATAKKTAINNQINMLQNGMEIMGAMNNLTFEVNGQTVGLADILDFSALPGA